MLARVQTRPSYFCWCKGRSGVRGHCLELKELKERRGLGKDLNRVFEREKRWASVHRRKCERCLTVHGSCTGRGEQICGLGALWGGPHTKREKEGSAVVWRALWDRGPHTTWHTRNCWVSFWLPQTVTRCKYTWDDRRDRRDADRHRC